MRSRVAASFLKKPLRGFSFKIFRPWLRFSTFCAEPKFFTFSFLSKTLQELVRLIDGGLENQVLLMKKMGENYLERLPMLCRRMNSLTLILKSSSSSFSLFSNNFLSKKSVTEIVEQRAIHFRLFVFCPSLEKKTSFWQNSWRKKKKP